MEKEGRIVPHTLVNLVLRETGRIREAGTKYPIVVNIQELRGSISPNGSITFYTGETFLHESQEETFKALPEGTWEYRLVTTEPDGVWPGVSRSSRTITKEEAQKILSEIRDARIARASKR